MMTGTNQAVTAMTVGSGLRSVKMNGQNMTPEKKTYELKKLVCMNPDLCDEEHNLCGNEDHHYGCECDQCLNYYYRKLK
jgi:hypothetical protein